jgi:glycosyltransferase involved in cell wall biosynthesis
MRILLVSHFFPPTHTAGTENYTLGLAQTLLERGHQVEVICAEDWDKGKAYWNGITQDVYCGVPVHRVHLNWAKAGNPNEVLFDSQRAEAWFGQFLQASRPDVAHITSTYSLGVGMLRALKQAKIPQVLTLMDFWFLCPRTILLRGDGQLCNGQTTPWECQQCLLDGSHIFHRTQSLLSKKAQSVLWGGVSHVGALGRLPGARGMALDMKWRKTEMKQALELSDVVLSHSRFVMDTFFQAGFSRQITHIPYGIDLRWAANYQGKSPSNVIRFGYLGQIKAMKGVHYLVEAFQHPSLQQRARLDIWGNLAQDPLFVEGLRSLIGESQAIALRGHFQRHRLAEILAEIDVLVVPSVWYENAPLVIQEAFATNTPVIATNLGGMAEAVRNDINGLLFERGNVTDLRSQLYRIVDEPGLLERLRSGIMAVKKVDEEVTELEAIYNSLVAKASPKQSLEFAG